MTLAGRRLRDIEKQAIIETLESMDWNQSKAARSLCISRPTMARKIKTYRITIPEAYRSTRWYERQAV